MKQLLGTAPSGVADAVPKGYVDAADALQVHLAGNETLTGTKTFTAPVTVAEQATPSAPVGALALYAKADGHLYSLGDTGSEARHPPLTVSATPPIGPKPGNLWLAVDAGPVTANLNFTVAPNNPALVAPGMWVQTQAGPTGQDVTFWIEDGL
jgi:hypothetical protein